MNFIDGIWAMPWYGNLLVLLIVVQITIAAVTIYLHRCQAHRSIQLHPSVSHFFRFWLWLTTGMVTKEWVAVHRKHHAHCEQADDPHSPHVSGIWHVVFGGVFLYVKACTQDTETRYGHSTPNDWIENKLYSRFPIFGIVIMAIIDILLFGIVAGPLMWGVQMLWIPFWAAGIINGVGHYWGYRNYPVQSYDRSTNIVPFAFWIGGEELHNNHHTFPTSAKFSIKPYEFDIGWLYISIMAKLGLAKVKFTAPKPQMAAEPSEVSSKTLTALIAYRNDIMAKFAKSFNDIVQAEWQTLREQLGKDSQTISPKQIATLLASKKTALSKETDKTLVIEVISKNQALQQLSNMRDQLASIWERNTATKDQMIDELANWCKQAEASNLVQLQNLSKLVRSYV